MATKPVFVRALRVRAIQVYEVYAVDTGDGISPHFIKRREADEWRCRKIEEEIREQRRNKEIENPTKKLESKQTDDGEMEFNRPPCRECIHFKIIHKDSNKKYRCGCEAINMAIDPENLTETSVWATRCSQFKAR